MALVSMRQLLDHAAEQGYGIPAFNVNNLEQIPSSTRPGAPQLTPQQGFLASAMEKSRRIDDNPCFASSRSL